MLALVPRKSKRCASSLPAWFRALSTSWWSTLLTMSNDESAMVLFLRSGDALLAPRGRGPPLLYAAPVPPHGGLPEWSKGADCKSVGTAYEGSNPSPATGREQPLICDAGRGLSPFRNPRAPLGRSLGGGAEDASPGAAGAGGRPARERLRPASGHSAGAAGRSGAAADGRRARRHAPPAAAPPGRQLGGGRRT